MSQLRDKIVVIAGIDNSVGRAVSAVCRRDGAVVMDLPVLEADETAWRTAFETCETAHGRVDLVVNALHACRIGGIAETGPVDFMAGFDAIGRQAWLCQKFAIAALKRAGGGVLVHVTTVLARVAAADCAAMCAAARGVLMSSKSAALECARAKDNVIVSTVLAGRIEGDPDHWPDGRLLPRAPIVTPADVADGVYFLVTDGAAYMTGVELPVDGGFLAS
ncbi:MAG: SDR family oxidoreductase [Rhodospirillaceae bacterium]|nr:SDR family oxidoreductase [Rhodospirillaceae bacterium]